MKKRFFRLAPLVWVQIVLCMVLGPIFHFGFSFDGNLIRIFLLDGLGFAPSTGLVGITLWFVSVLFWVGLFYFYIAKIFDKRYLNLIIWLVTIFSLGLILNAADFRLAFGTHSNIALVFNSGVMRGLYGFGIGYFISMLDKMDFLKAYKSKSSMIIFSILELFLFVLVVYYTIFTTRIIGRSPFIIIFLFSILFYLFIVKKGILSRILDNRLSAFLGQTSYAIYVMHILVGVIFNSIVENNLTELLLHPQLLYLGKVLVAIIFGMISFYIFEKPINKLVKCYL